MQDFSSKSTSPHSNKDSVSSTSGSTKNYGEAKAKGFMSGQSVHITIIKGGRWWWLWVFYNKYRYQRDQNVEDVPFPISDKTDEDDKGPETVVDVEDEDVQEMHHNLDPEDHPEVSSVEETLSEEDHSVDETEAESVTNPFVEETDTDSEEDSSPLKTT